MANSKRWLIQITGTVQGVGFRPFVYRKASELGLTGYVCNTAEGVSIEAQGTSEKLSLFIAKLENDAPPLAHILNVEKKSIKPVHDDGFAIQLSTEADHDLRPAIAPDIATCDECLNELDSEKDRRHNYPFINCTDCGPRYTIIEGFPYDRPKTSMKIFDMCPECNAEYGSPMNRRFHAQPNACPKCGPMLKTVLSPGTSQARWYTKEHDPLMQTFLCLRAGGIVAIKGLGGFHLACDAKNDEAVKRLRSRKHRDQKPFAIMVRDLDSAKMICHISDDEAKILISPRRPIILLRKKENNGIAQSVAPGNKMLGVMLPYTPLHHLLFKNSPVLVMTSANFSDEPIIKDEEEARKKLDSIADLFLTHNRPIYMRTDDSVVRVIDGAPMIMRRARGYVPSPLTLPSLAPQILALGSDIKNAFCLTKGMDAYLSQHIGDLENPETHEHFEKTIDHLIKLLKINPEIIAYDMHPNYFSSQYGRRHSAAHIEIQHHHAHITSCMAEHGLPNEKVIGIALDGAGFGPDGTIWGGEILRADYTGFERLARLKPVPQPGGDTAAREIWRMACAYLEIDEAEKLVSLGIMPDNEIPLVYQSMAKRINSPLTSSLGRLFDAVSAITGLSSLNSFEGQAAMMLEQCADESIKDHYSFTLEQSDKKILEIDFKPAIKAIVEDVCGTESRSTISTRFHNTVVNAIADAVKRIGGNERVVLSGGCMQNARLLAGLVRALESVGRRVYSHRLVPPNDGGLGLGQAAIAAYS